MAKQNLLNEQLAKNNGYITSADVNLLGISRSYFQQFVRQRNLIKVSRGIYMSEDAWDDGMYVIQTRYPKAIFSHETALYLLKQANREPIQYSVTLLTGKNGSGLTKDGVRVYKVKEELLELGLIEAKTPAGNIVRSYDFERTVCDFIRARNRLDSQDIQDAIRNYVYLKGRNVPKLTQYAKAFSIESIVLQYLEILL
ncbi:MAG: type IV toxin-antitoxin system AbiEi family antitoxin domain-containing protein [Anaerovoracaceae bacterium]